MLVCWTFSEKRIKPKVLDLIARDLKLCPLMNKIWLAFETFDQEIIIRKLV